MIIAGLQRLLNFQVLVMQSTAKCWLMMPMQLSYAQACLWCNI